MLDKRDDESWYEVWADPCVGPYVLVVYPTVRGDIVVYDPRERSIPFRHQSYDEVVYWLQEDEYERVVGRMHDGEDDERE
jgi:hypothetical protein